MSNCLRLLYENLIWFVESAPFLVIFHSAKLKGSVKLFNTALEGSLVSASNNTLPTGEKMYSRLLPRTKLIKLTNKPFQRKRGDKKVTKKT